MSETIPMQALYAALVKAQASMGAAKKDSTNPAFKSKYADWASVVDAVRGPLADNGLGFLQLLTTTPEGLAVTTRLIHSSGESMETTLALPVAQKTAQGYGSAATYGKRYSLSALLGVATDEDDDGNAASRGAERVFHETKAAEPIIDPKIHADHLASWVKLSERFAALGVFASDVTKKLGRTLAINATPTNEEWERMIEWGKELKASSPKADSDPDELAREEVRRQAEASLAEFDAPKKANEKAAQEGMKGTTPRTAEAMKRALEQSLFKGAVDKLNAAKTEEEAIQIGGTFAELRKNLTAGDVKALERKYADTILILKDKAKEKKRVKIQDQTEPF